MSKKYYSIRLEREDAFHKAGDQIVNADNTLYIGQNESCDIRIANESQYEDTIFAVIEKRTDGKGWKLIGLSPYKEHEIRVNGTPIHHVHFLNDGDRISFSGQRQELTFSIREDDKYTTSGIVVMGKRNNRSVIVWLALISLALIGFVLYQLSNAQMSGKNQPFGLPMIIFMDPERKYPLLSGRFQYNEANLKEILVKAHQSFNTITEQMMDEVFKTRTLKQTIWIAFRKGLRGGFWLRRLLLLP